MANELCIFCGQKPGTFRSTTLACGSTIQVACKACEKELKDLDEIEELDESEEELESSSVEPYLVVFE